MAGYVNTDFTDFTDLLSNDDLEEEPVPLDVFVHDKKYLNIKKISPLQRRLIACMSQIYKYPTLVDLYGEEEANRIWREENYTEVIMKVGKGSGKDFSSRCAFCYVVHKLHCLKDPVGYYGKAAGTYIDLLNLAVNADQAKGVFFDPLRNMMKISPYFKQYAPFEIRKTQLEFDNRPIRIHSGNSEAEAWEGLDLLLVVLDEIAAFKTEGQLKGENKNRLSAKAIYDMSHASVVSRFPEVGKVILLSFPRHSTDFIMQRYEEAATEEGVMRVKAATWEMNPLITREMLDNEFKRHPIEAEARFAANPPLAYDAFFRDPERVRNCFIGEKEVIDAGTPEEKVKYHKVEALNPIDEFGRIKPWFKAKDEYVRFIHVDLAVKRDFAAISMCHSPGVRKIETGPNTFEMLPVVKMDLIHYWEALEGQDIDFANIREFIFLLNKRFPIGLVTFDQWNSVHMRQDLEKRNMRTDHLAVNINAFDTLATCFYDGRFSGYYDPLLVEEQLLKLQIINARKVEHISQGHDDLAFALAGAVTNVCTYMDVDTEIELEILGSEDDWEEWENDEDEEDTKPKSSNVRHHVEWDEDDDDGWNLQAI